MDLHEVTEALEQARCRFHSMAAALNGHLAGSWEVDLAQLRDMLQEGNNEASQILERLHEQGVRG